MKAIFIAYDQAHHEGIIDILNRHACRGFTGLGIVQGRGSVKGEPHYGTHAWPSLAQPLWCWTICISWTRANPVWD